MKMLVTAIAIMAATPVAAQTTAPAHSNHDTPAAGRNGKSCCCEDRGADKADANKKKMACCEKADGDKKANGDTPAAPHSEHGH